VLAITGALLGLAVVGETDVLAEGLSLGVEVVGAEFVGDPLGLAEGDTVTGVEVVGVETVGKLLRLTVGINVGVIVDPLIQFAALGGAQLAYVPWQHSSLLQSRNEIQVEEEATW
jgi:hypothetical protein